LTFGNGAARASRFVELTLIDSGAQLIEFACAGRPCPCEPPVFETSKGGAVGYIHNLSKRTALHATYARVSNSGGAAQALNGAVTAAGRSSSGLDVGIKHSF
jgi:hypothetical protein